MGGIHYALACAIAAPSNTFQAEGGPADKTLLIGFTAWTRLSNDLLKIGATRQNNVIITDSGNSYLGVYYGAGKDASRACASLMHLSHAKSLTMIGSSAHN